MNQHRLYRTIENLSEQKFRTDEQLLNSVLERIIHNEEIPIKGGRIWKLEPTQGTFRLMTQYGEIEPIKKNFRLRILSYPMFLQLGKKQTIVATETNKYLRQRGIKQYSATGIGEKVPWKGYMLYPYVIAFNAEYMKQDEAYALNIISNVLTSALKNKRIESKAAALEKDLDKAREIQRSILPEHEMRFHQYELYGVSLPERVVGGDFFDYMQASGDKDRLGVVIGDAASKGLSAAAQAMYVSGALRMGVEYQTKMDTFIGNINRLVSRTFSAEHFLSMVYAEFTPSDKGLIFYVNAGHSTPILLHDKTDEVEMLPATGQILGPFPSERYKADFTFMKKGDVLLLYTDGITDATNETGEMFGEQRLVNIVKANRSRSSKELCQLILEQVQMHNRMVEYSDDKTVLAIKRVK
ncbi:MAG: serine/threonine-protein phosphatase [Ignavibacteriae bacterium]|nr:serine/threonine-protein phosphatase [Ignavibacteriota bacterium]